MSITEKRGNNQKISQDIKRGDKLISDIKVVVEFCNMNNKHKEDCIKKALDAIGSTMENNSDYYKKLAKKIKKDLEMDGKTDEKGELIQNGVWNVIVGSDFGAWVCFDKENAIYFRLEEIYFLIFRFGYDI